MLNNRYIYIFKLEKKCEQFENIPNTIIYSTPKNQENFVDIPTVNMNSSVSSEYIPQNGTKVFRLIFH